MLGKQIGTSGAEGNPASTPLNLTCTLNAPPRPHLHGQVKSSPSSIWVPTGAQLRLSGGTWLWHGQPWSLQPQEAELGARLQQQLFPCSLQWV